MARRHAVLHGVWLGRRSNAVHCKHRRSVSSAEWEEARVHCLVPHSLGVVIPASDVDRASPAATLRTTEFCASDPLATNELEQSNFGLHILRRNFYTLAVQVKQKRRRRRRRRRRRSTTPLRSCGCCRHDLFFHPACVVVPRQHQQPTKSCSFCFPDKQTSDRWNQNQTKMWQRKEVPKNQQQGGVQTHCTGTT